MKNSSELAECLARIPPKITLYRPLFKCSYVGRLLLLMFSNDLLLQSKGTCWPKPHTETEYESQITTIL